MEGILNAGPAISVGLDPAVVLGKEIGAAMRRYSELEEAETKAGRKGDCGVHWMETDRRHVYDKENALKEALACTRATTLPGAAIQIAQALNLFDLILDEVPEAVETYEFKAKVRAVERLLHSALAVVDDKASEKLAETVDEYFGGRCSPWIDAEVSIAERERDAS